MASPIVRETIKKLRARKALLEKQVKGPLLELAQIEADLEALGATNRRRASGAPRGATQAAVLRAVRNGATSPPEIADRTGLAPASVTRSVAAAQRGKLLVTGANGLALSKAGRDRLRALEAG